MKVQSVTLLQPLTNEVLTYYAASRGYDLTTDDEHLGGGIWMSKDGGPKSFIAAGNLAGHGPEVESKPKVSGHEDMPALTEYLGEPTSRPEMVSAKTLTHSEKMKAIWAAKRTAKAAGPLQAPSEKLESEPV